MLVVEDDRALRDVYVQLLADAGHSARVADDGANGLASLSGDIDLVVTDLNMPRMSGVAFLQALRDSREFAKMPVLVITARPQSLPTELQGPLTSVIRKPFHLDQFTRFIETVATRVMN